MVKQPTTRAGGEGTASSPARHPVYEAALSACLAGGSHVITFPTGSGKTHLARAVTAAEDPDLITVIVVPLKALAAELADTLRAALPGRGVQAYTSDTRTRPYAAQQVVILTPERLDLLTRRWRAHPWLARVGALIVDEVHLIGDAGRGHRLDAGVTRLRAVNPLLRVLALSATVGDPGTLAAWLGAAHWTHEDRAVPLAWHLHECTPKGRTRLLKRLVTPGTVVFVNSRARAQDLAATLGGAEAGVAAHHAGLSPEVREGVERDFRSGALRALVATGTLEMGVNLPCTQVILHDLSVATGKTPVPLPTLNVRQRAGRAGRSGQGRADVHLLGNEDELAAAYPLPPLRSALAGEAAQDDFALGSVDGGLAGTAAQLTRLLASTFAGFTGAGLDAGAVVARLISLGGVTDTGVGLRVTPLGRVTSRHLLPLSVTARALDLGEDLSAFDLTVLALEAVGTALRTPETTFARDRLGAWLRAVPSALLDRGAVLDLGVVRAASLVISACQDGEEDTARTEDVWPGTLRALREDAARVLRAWRDVRGDLPRLHLTAVSVTTGVPYEWATLTLLSGVGGATARRLAHAGLPDVETLAQASVEDLAAAGISEARAARLIERASALSDTFTEDVTRSGEPPASRPAAFGVGHWPLEVCPRRLARAARLDVTCGEQGAWVVRGGEGVWAVTPDFTCPCPDAARGRVCKHALAARLAAGDERVTVLCSQIGAGLDLEWLRLGVTGPG